MMITSFIHLRETDKNNELTICFHEFFVTTNLRIFLQFVYLFLCTVNVNKVSSFYHLCVEYFSQFSFDSEMYTKSTTVSKQLLIMYTFLNQMRIGKDIRLKDNMVISL